MTPEHPLGVIFFASILLSLVFMIIAFRNASKY
jgi:hypothetical protein